MAEMLHRRRFTVDEYHRMGESGILADDERLELIAGHIVVREPIGARHAGTVDRLTRLWTSRLGDGRSCASRTPASNSQTSWWRSKTCSADPSGLVRSSGASPSGPAASSRALQPC